MDRLDELLERGKRIPFTDRVMLERVAMLNIIDQMRIAIPPEIQRAAELEQEREQLLALARAEAEEIIAAAQGQAEGMVQEHAIRRAADMRAAETLALAARQANEILDQAEVYASSELRGLEKQLARLQRVVANGLEHLDARHQARHGSNHHDAPEKSNVSSPR